MTPATVTEDLAAHRVAEIHTMRIRTRWPRLLGRNALFEEHGYGREAIVRHIVTDRGAAGWGLSRHPGPGQFEISGLVDRRLSELFDPAVGVTEEEAMPLDFALHDLAGNILGVPVFRMIGTAGPTTQEVCGSATYFDDITPAYHPGGVGVVLENCRQDWQMGYRAFKIKIGRGHRWMGPEAGMARDVKVTRAIREEFPEAMLQVDANDGYDCRSFC
ncbi:hypothetical protein LCGC14_2192160, partial [marine sediment metagenome]